MYIFSVVLPLLSSLSGTPNTSTISNKEPEVVEKEDSNNAFTDDAFLYTSVGLVAVGGAGGVIIANNKKKEKDTPIKEINHDDYEK